MLFFWSFYSAKILKEMYPDFQELNCFQKKHEMFPEQQISILNDFWSYDTEDWSNDAENTALITGINLI